MNVELTRWWDSFQQYIYKITLKWSEVKWKSLSDAQLFVTPWTIQCMIFSRPEYWSRYPFPSLGDLPNPGLKPRAPTVQADSLPADLQGKPQMTLMHILRGFPGGSSSEEPACQCRRHMRCVFDPRVGMIPWRRTSMAAHFNILAWRIS